MDKHEGKMILVNKTEINVSFLKASDGEPIIVVTGLTYEEWDALPKAVKDAYIKSVDDDFYYGSPQWLSKLMAAVKELRVAYLMPNTAYVVQIERLLEVADDVQKWRDED